MLPPFALIPAHDPGKGHDGHSPEQSPPLRSSMLSVPATTFLGHHPHHHPRVTNSPPRVLTSSPADRALIISLLTDMVNSSKLFFVNYKKEQY